jgi:hypothetical protein
MVLSDIENNLSEDNENNKGTQKDVFDNVNVQDDFFYKKAKEHIIIYQNDNTNISSIMDIIATYVKGQRILYTESKTLCEQRLSSLMVPSILFTVICSIVNLILKDYIYGNVITSCLNVLIAFILALINYLKLDARAEAHRSSAYKYDKLLTYIEFQSCKQLFLHFEKNKMPEVFTKIENDVKDIKETNQFVLPEVIRYNFPILTNINIFSEIKKILNKEMILMNKLAYVLNESFAFLLLGYIILNIAYSVRLKHIPILDVTLIATGFLLRIFAGGIVADVFISRWIILMTFLLALFLALAKRREDVLLFNSRFQKFKNPAWN